MLRSDDKTLRRPGHVPVQALRQGIRFEGVSFAYADGLPPALDNVSFEIPAGRTTALVGASGAGKTTLIHLLLRLYTPGAGTIRVDGVPLQDLRRTDWLGLLAVAGQDVDLIEGTVLDNIRMADANGVATKTCWTPRAWPAWPSSSSRCRTATTPGSVSRATAFPAASGSAWAWRARCCDNRNC